MLRLAHLSPDTPPVDVYVDPVSPPGAGRAFPGVGYGTVSDYQQVPPGTYAISLRRAGADAVDPPVLSTTVEIAAGQARTVAGVGPFADLGLAVLEDDLTPPTSGTARVRVVAAAASAPRVDVALAGGRALAGGLAFADVGAYVEVPGGVTALVVTPAGGPPVSLPVGIAAGAVSSVLVLDAPGGGLMVRPTPDAAGAGAVPVGGVEAGGGGATGVSSPVRPIAAAVVLVSVAALALTVAARTGRRGPAVRALGAVLAVLAGSIPLLAPDPTPARLPGEPVAAAATGSPIALQAWTSRAAAEPLRVRVPGIGVDTPLAPVGVDAAGALAPPVDPTRAGWFTGGPAPGDVGPAVLAGHVDSTAGPAVFWRLGELSPGDEVLVDLADGTTARFTVTRVERHAKDAFPTADVYGPTPDAELRLVTCGGEFDRSARSYRDNVVVFARLAS
ncbi:class F sortase [Trujillonella endophytica]|uniref:Sortase family protein n=1 Tax=Trujillonella endophytica TaxID=673521 RepID=A0A1H8TKP6_9ACTN|nr:class F sortase [Trujillella endophytica]SEO91058.1 Sortase family protein [Trujillella endophytica]